MNRSRRVAITLTIAQWDLLLKAASEGHGGYLHPKQDEALNQAEEDIAAAIAPREGPQFVAKGVTVWDRIGRREVVTFAYMDDAREGRKAATAAAVRRNAGGS